MLKIREEILQKFISAFISTTKDLQGATFEKPQRFTLLELSTVLGVPHLFMDALVSAGLAGYGKGAHFRNRVYYPLRNSKGVVAMEAYCNGDPELLKNRCVAIWKLCNDYKTMLKTGQWTRAKASETIAALSKKEYLYTVKLPEPVKENVIPSPDVAPKHVEPIEPHLQVPEMPAEPIPPPVKKKGLPFERVQVTEYMSGTNVTVTIREGVLHADNTITPEHMITVINMKTGDKLRMVVTGEVTIL